ncbi:hypothetical protein PVAG01_05212 [Phlyctema vagabunda]|uniref:Tat pathway signal sequence n=1 Tax=Phlyctema vagabunda TaxID=108571 RepID=A0ABR4PJF4_9HELO
MRSVSRIMNMYKDGVHSTGGMPAIPEDQDAPPIPERSLYRPSMSKASLNATPPPDYDFVERLYLGDRHNPIDEKLFALRNHRQLAKRGGWRRLALKVLIAVLLIISLAVGLGVGLSRRRNSDASSNTDNGNSGTQNRFPAGSYAIETVLATQSTSCTSNPATWRCYPYTTYSESNSTSSSAATFAWIISYSATNHSYSISATENIFSITFSNQTLTLQDVGLATEHYSFQVSMQKPVRPSVALTSSNAAATCYFYDAVFRGYLYTTMASSLPINATATESGKAYVPWPYAVRVEQVSASGTDTPTCLDSQGNSLGDFSADEGNECDCLYRNTRT